MNFLKLTLVAVTLFVSSAASASIMVFFDQQDWEDALSNGFSVVDQLPFQPSNALISNGQQLRFENGSFYGEVRSDRYTNSDPLRTGGLEVAFDFVSNAFALFDIRGYFGNGANALDADFAEFGIRADGLTLTSIASLTSFPTSTMSTNSAGDVNGQLDFIGFIKTNGTFDGFSLVHVDSVENREDFVIGNIAVANQVPAPATLGLLGFAFAALRLFRKK